jgi:hypothetical protein
MLEWIFPWLVVRRLRAENEALKAELERLTDRDARGRFVRK